MQNGFKTHFSSDIQFATFIKCAIGLSFIPLDRLQEGLDILHELGVALPKKYHKFVDKFLNFRPSSSKPSKNIVAPTRRTGRVCGRALLIQPFLSPHGHLQL